MRRLAAALAVAILCSGWAPADGQPTADRPAIEAWLGKWITSHLTAKRCWQYAPLVDRWNPDFDLPREVVLAVMAKESACMEGTDDGTSVGLMAVTPRPWLFSHAELLQPSLNVYAGMFVLHSALEQADGDMALALAAYNCGWESLNAGRCIDGGGHDYAASVLNEWLPLIEEAR